MSDVLKVNKPRLINHCSCFPENLRCLIIGSSGSGKSQLMFNYLIRECTLHNKEYWDYDVLILVSTSLAQEEYEWIIKSYKAKLNKEQITKLFEIQSKFKDIDKFIERLTSEMKDKNDPGFNIEIECLDDPALLPSPKDLANKYKNKKILVVCDDSMLLEKKKITNYFSTGRPLHINTVYILQKYFYRDTKTIRDNANYFILFNSSIRDLKEIYKELGTSFNSESEFIKYCKDSWKSKYGYVS